MVTSQYSPHAQTDNMNTSSTMEYVPDNSDKFLTEFSLSKRARVTRGVGVDKHDLVTRLQIEDGISRDTIIQKEKDARDTLTDAVSARMWNLASAKYAKLYPSHERLP